MLVASVAFLYGTVLRIDLYSTSFVDLLPHPDGPEYFAGAVSLASEGTFRIHSAGQMVPPRYPFGYSLLITPLIWLGVEPITTPFRVNQLIALGFMLWGFVLFWRRGDRLAAGLTSLFIATLPGMTALARSPMSDLAGSVLVFWAFYCFWKFVRSPPGDIRWGLGGTALVALAIWVRTPNQLFTSLPVLMALFGQSQPWARRIRTLVLFGVMFVGVVAPALLYNYSSFGSPLTTGYDYWMPRQPSIGSNSGASAAFGTHRLSYQLLAIWQELSQTGRPQTMATFFGSGGYLNPSLVLLAMLGLGSWWLERDRAAMVMGGAAFISFVPVLFLRVADARSWFAFILLLPVVAGRQTSSLLRRAVEHRPRRPVLTLLLLAIVAATLVGWPGQRTPFESVELLNISRFYAEPRLYRLVEQLAAMSAGRPTLVLSQINPSYVYALTEGDRIVTPLDAQLMPTFHESWFPPSKREVQLHEAVSSNRLIFALLNKGSAAEVVPPPAGRRWQLIMNYREMSLSALVAEGS